MQVGKTSAQASWQVRVSANIARLRNEQLKPAFVLSNKSSIFQQLKRSMSQSKVTSAERAPSTRAAATKEKVPKLHMQLARVVIANVDSWIRRMVDCTNNSITFVLLYKCTLAARNDNMSRVHAHRSFPSTCRSKQSI